MIFQDFVRYNLSAADNIAVGRIAAREDRARIKRAASAGGERSNSAGECVRPWLEVASIPAIIMTPALMAISAMPTTTSPTQIIRLGAGE